MGLLIHIQALLLARHLRGDLDCYPPFIGKVKRAVVMYILITYDVATDDKAGSGGCTDAWIEVSEFIIWNF